MAIEVEGPDGAVIEFPDGTGGDIIKGVMAKRYGGGQQAALSPPTQSRMEMMAGGAKPATEAMPTTWGDTATDVAKSGGIGLVQGGIGLATLPGNMEMLGRMGIDKAGQMMGYDPQTTKGQLLPHYGHAKKFVEGYTGEFYEPKTTAGKYARTVGEFAPMALNPTVGLATRAASTIGGGLGSEFAGQMTEGTAAEPWARFGGGVVGGMLPRAAIRTGTPAPTSPDHARQVDVLRREGVTDLTAGQRTDKRALKWGESVTQDTPFGGTRAAEMQTRQAEQFTRAALQRAGVQADRADPAVINARFDRFDQQFGTLTQNTTIPPSTRLMRDLQRAVQEYEATVPPTLHNPVVRGVAEDFMQLVRARQSIPGEAYSTARSLMDKRARATVHSDTPYSDAMFAIRNALDNAAERALPAQLAGQFREVRREYRNTLILVKAATGAGADAAKGLISPAQLANAAKATDRRGYARGRGDLDELARAGVAVMTPLPQSGTAPRLAAQGVMQSISAAGGMAAGGLEGAAINLAMSLGGPALAARGLMSRPVQGYLGNQTLAPIYNALQSPALRSHSTVAGPMMDHSNALMRQPTEVYLTPDGQPR